MKIVIGILLLATILISGCTSGSYDPSRKLPSTDGSNSQSKDLLEKVTYYPDKLTQEDMQYIEGLLDRVEDKDATFTGAEVQLLMSYFGVISPRKIVPDTVMIREGGIGVNSPNVLRSENSIELELINGRGAFKVPLTGKLVPKTGTACLSPVLTGIYKNASIVAGVTQIENGDTFTLKWDCENDPMGDRFEADFSFEIMSIDTGNPETFTGSISSKYS